MLIGDWGQFEISLRTRKEASFTKCTLLIVVFFLDGKIDLEQLWNNSILFFKIHRWRCDNFFSISSHFTY